MKRFLVGIGALITAFFGIWLSGRKSGKDSIRADMAEAAAKDGRRANEIDNEVRALSDDDLYRELRNGPKK